MSRRGGSDLDVETRARLSLIFPAGAPDVGVGGMSVARSSLTQVSDDDESLPEGVHWHVYGTATGEAYPPFLLFGDLTVRSEGWFGGATAVALVLFREGTAPDLESPEDENALVEALGPWYSNVLYDWAAGAVRRQLATSPDCKLDVPILTPDTHLGLRYPAEAAHE